MEKQQPNFYSIMPATVRYDKNISANAKLLYSEITARLGMHKRCYVGNEKFAELYGVDERTIRRWLNELVEAKYLVIEYDKGRRNLIPCDTIEVPNKPVELPKQEPKKNCVAPDKVVKDAGQKCPHDWTKLSAYINTFSINSLSKERECQLSILELAKEYFKINNLRGNAEACFWHYEALKWKLNGKKIDFNCFEALARKWSATERDISKPNAPTQNNAEHQAEMEAKKEKLNKELAEQQLYNEALKNPTFKALDTRRRELISKIGWLAHKGEPVSLLEREHKQITKQCNNFLEGLRK